jgi:hypothetical protein
MTEYRAISNMAVSGTKAIRLALYTETPLGQTYQSETVYVEAYSDEEARNKAARLFKSGVMRCLDVVSDGPRYADTWSSTRVVVGEDTYKIPVDVYNTIRNDLTAEIRTLEVNADTLMQQVKNLEAQVLSLETSNSNYVEDIRQLREQIPGGGIVE